MQGIDTSSLVTLRQLSAIGRAARVNAASQSTGVRINRAAGGGDDASGVISSESLRAVLASLESESAALQRVNAVAATADAALGEISSLKRESEAIEVALANRAGFSDAERAALRDSLAQNQAAADRVAASTTFNGQVLLDGSVELRVGESSLSIGGARGLDADAIDQMRGAIGLFQRDTISSRIESLGIAIQNITEAESIVRDTDFAAVTASGSRLEILGLTAIAALGMVDENRQAVLGLFS